MTADAGRKGRGFNPDYAGKRAECDGGSFIEGTRMAGRQEFGGTLTGDYIEDGDPSWRWYLMTDLVLKPQNFQEDAVWCLEGNLFLCDEP